MAALLARPFFSLQTIPAGRQHEEICSLRQVSDCHFAVQSQAACDLYATTCNSLCFQSFSCDSRLNGPFPMCLTHLRDRRISRPRDPLYEDVFAISRFPPSRSSAWPP